MEGACYSNALKVKPGINDGNKTSFTFPLFSIDGEESKMQLITCRIKITMDEANKPKNDGMCPKTNPLFQYTVSGYSGN